MPNKNLLIITHQLSRTGAPLVLLDMIKLYRENGCDITLITLMDGELREDIEAMNIPIIVKDNFWHDRENFSRYASSFDTVIANTLVTYQVILALYGRDVPVIWWLHEGVQYFEYFKKVLPDFAHMPANIRVYCVSRYVSSVIMERYGVEPELLPFSVKKLTDETIDPEKKDPWPALFGRAHERIRFFTCGTYSAVKAQDVLAAAIEQLKPDTLKRCEFLFCGNEEMFDPNILEPVKELCGRYPDNIKKVASLPRAEVLRIMKYTDFALIPSRIDPMPTVAAEAMMMGKINLITDVCGAAKYIDDGISGILMRSEDPAGMAEKIEKAVKLSADGEKYKKMAVLSEKLYHDNFSEEAVNPKMLALL